MKTTVKLNLERGTCRITSALYLGAETEVVFDREGSYGLVLTEPFADTPSEGVKVWAQSEGDILKLNRQALLDAFIAADARQPNMTVTAKAFVTDEAGNTLADGDAVIEYSPEYIIDPAEYPSAREVLAQATTAKIDAEKAANLAKGEKNTAVSAKEAAISAQSSAEKAAEAAAKASSVASEKAREAILASTTALSAASSAGAKASEADKSASAAVIAKEEAEKARDDAKANIADFSAELNKKAPIGADGKIPSDYLPSYVDDVLEFDSASTLPASGDRGKIYVALDTGKTYRWSGSIYVEISKPVEFGETEGTAYEGNRGKALEETIRNNANKEDIKGLVSVKEAQDFTDEEKERASVNGGYRYRIYSPEAEVETVGDTEYLKYSVKDYAINIILLDTAKPVRIYLPAPVDATRRCRDFIVKLKVTSEVLPVVEFVKSGADKSIAFESSDDDWATIESGINYFTFTETEREV